jgi:hypothetical protein
MFIPTEKAIKHEKKKKGTPMLILALRYKGGIKIWRKRVLFPTTF